MYIVYMFVCTCVHVYVFVCLLMTIILIQWEGLNDLRVEIAASVKQVPAALRCLLCCTHTLAIGVTS